MSSSDTYQHRHTFESFDVQLGHENPWPKTKFKKGLKYGDVSIHIKNSPELQEKFKQLTESINSENKNHGKNI